MTLDVRGFTSKHGGHVLSEEEVAISSGTWTRPGRPHRRGGFAAFFARSYALSNEEFDRVARTCSCERGDETAGGVSSV